MPQSSLREIGPVQILTVAFDGNHFKGEILPELERLKKAQVIRLIDLLVVRKDSTGAIATLTASDLDWEEAASFGALTGAITGAAELSDGHAFGDETRNSLTESVPPGSSAAIALVEHVWAKPLQAAIERAQGVEIGNDWLKVDDVIARGIARAGSIDELDEEDE
jgi:uncharacterized membrane protein